MLQHPHDPGCCRTNGPRSDHWQHLGPGCHHGLRGSADLSDPDGPINSMVLGFQLGPMRWFRSRVVTQPPMTTGTMERNRLIKTSVWPCCQLRSPNLQGPGDSMILWYQDSVRCQPGPWVSSLPSVVTGVSDINVDPGCHGAMDSDIALGCNSSLNGTIATGGSEGR